jgi:hypothetical protein
MIAGACLLVLASLGLLGCAAGEPPQSATNASPDTTTAPVTDGVLQGTGTIRYVDLEGGFYGLVAEDGTKYDPSPLPDSLRADDLRVRFRVQKKDVMTTRMWGTPVEVLEIERIGDKND